MEVVKFTKVHMDDLRKQIAADMPNKSEVERAHQLISRVLQESKAKAKEKYTCTSFNLHENGDLDVIMQ